jgi:hypothetical protein
VSIWGGPSLASNSCMAVVQRRRRKLSPRTGRHAIGDLHLLSPCEMHGSRGDGCKSCCSEVGGGCRRLQHPPGRRSNRSPTRPTRSRHSPCSAASRLPTSVFRRMSTAHSSRLLVKMNSCAEQKRGLSAGRGFIRVGDGMAGVGAGCRHEGATVSQWGRVWNPWPLLHSSLHLTE